MKTYVPNQMSRPNQIISTTSTVKAIVAVKVTVTTRAGAMIAVTITLLNLHQRYKEILLRSVSVHQFETLS